MKVWIIYFDTRDFYDGEQFHSIWSTESKAQDYIRSVMPESEREHYSIEEYLLNSYNKN